MSDPPVVGSPPTRSRTEGLCDRSAHLVASIALELLGIKFLVIDPARCFFLRGKVILMVLWQFLLKIWCFTNPQQQGTPTIWKKCICLTIFSLPLARCPSSALWSKVVEQLKPYGCGWETEIKTGMKGERYVQTLLGIFEVMILFLEYHP